MGGSQKNGKGECKSVPLIVVLATKTEEKLIHFNFIARLNSFPIHFIGLNEILDTFPSALEDTGSSYENAKQKIDCTSDSFHRFKEQGLHRQALEAKIRSLGASFDPERVLFASEDSIIRVPDKVWPCLRRQLRHVVSEELLKSAEGKSGAPGLGAETGPILGAVGIPSFMDMLHKAGKEAGLNGSPILIEDEVTLLFKRLGNAPGMPLENISICVKHCLSEEGYRKGKARNPEEDIFLTIQFLSPTQNRSTPIADMMRKYFKEDAPRAQVVHKLAKMFGCVSEERAIKRPSFSKNQTMITREIDLHPPCVPEGSDEGGKWYAYLDIKRVLHEADAFLIPSFDHSDLRQKRWAYYVLFAMVAAKQTEARYAAKPIVVDNSTGCWRDAQRLEFLLSNAGFAKNFTRFPFFDAYPVRKVLPEGVCHQASAYIDYIKAPKNGFRSVAEDILNQRAKEYHRFMSVEALDKKTQYGGTWPKTFPAGVAVYTSASNDNANLHKRLFDLGHFLATENCHLVYGGGDVHAMGALYRGAKAANGCIAAFSTPSIVKNETDKGYLPESQYHGLCRDLAARRTHFANLAKVHVVEWGGIGTLEEMLSFAVLYDAFPSFRDRRMIVSAGSIYEDQNILNPLAKPGLAALYGCEDEKKLSSSYGVDVSRSLAETKDLITRHVRASEPKNREVWRGPKARGQERIISISRP